jgi:hypothetical protein
MTQTTYAGGDAIADWKDAIEAEFKVTRNRAQAVCNVVRKNPELHADYLRAVNEPLGRPVPLRFQQH